jgi:hypothetical protein
MALPYRDMLNRVLRAVGEDEISDAETEVTESYHKLVGVFINQFKEEIEDAHNWRDLQQTHTATVEGGDSDAVIVDANERSRVQRMQTETGYVPLVFDVTDATDPIPLTERPLAELNYKLTIDIEGAEEPNQFAVFAQGDGALSIRVYPKPTTQRLIRMIMYTPQPRLGDDDLDEVIMIPARPLEIAAIWYALEERGEELGQGSMFTEERFRKALDDAIARDDAEQGGNDLLVV